MCDAAEAAINRGQRAAEILADPLVAEAFHGLRTLLMEQWAASPARDQEGREALFHRMKAAEDVERMFRVFLQDGQMAAEKLRVEAAERAVNG